MVADCVDATRRWRTSLLLLWRQKRRSMWSRLTNVTLTAQPDIYMKSNPCTRIWTRPQRRPFFLAPAEIPRWIDSRCAVKKKQVGPSPPLWLSLITWACRAYTFHFPRLLCSTIKHRRDQIPYRLTMEAIGGRPNWLHTQREREKEGWVVIR